MNVPITTEQVAKQLGMSSAGVRTILNRYPHLRPALQVGHMNIWTPEEVERLVAHRLSGKKGKPRKRR